MAHETIALQSNRSVRNQYCFLKQSAMATQVRGPSGFAFARASEAMGHGGARRLAFASAAARGDDRRSDLARQSQMFLRGLAEPGVIPLRERRFRRGGGASAA